MKHISKAILTKKDKKKLANYKFQPYWIFSYGLFPENGTTLNPLNIFRNAPDPKN